jgi:hypothetical protein
MMDNATIHTSPETNEFLLANNLNLIGIFSGPFSFFLFLIQFFK